MNNPETWKTLGIQILQLHSEECGDGSCGCGCGELIVAAKVPEKATESEECCQPICGPDTCG
jgi:hypothetical protein